MSFICNNCRETVLENKGVSLGKSYGPYELCDRAYYCHDLKHYQCKKDWQQILKSKENDE
ncbi:MAG TPA: hypothetical protein VN704_04795 [Verrucomicrobiae bacterium]|nr:hypothetical protein [Verrucomicrobiae bacterium]